MSWWRWQQRQNNQKPAPERGKGGFRACAGNGPGVSREEAAASWTRTLQVAFVAVFLLFASAGEGGGDASRSCEVRLFFSWLEMGLSTYHIASPTHKHLCLNDCAKPSLDGSLVKMS